MIHFITLQKAKALALSSGTEDNAIIAAGLNHELMKMGFVLDAAAMRDGADSTDDYLAEWRRGEPVECGEDLEAEAANRAAALEAEYPAERVKSLVDNGGREPG